MTGRKIRDSTQKERIREMFLGLYPGENPAWRFARFQSRKYLTAAAILAAGAAAAAAVFAAEHMSGRLQQGGVLCRNEWGKGSYFVTLLACTEENQECITFEVKERKYTQQELLELKERALADLGQLMLNGNPSLSQVTRNLNLAGGAAGYPFSIRWRSSNDKRIKGDGTVVPEGLPLQGEEVVLTAILSYEENKWEEDFKVRVMPKETSPQEEYLQKLREALTETDSQYDTSDKIYLPAKLEGQTVRWEERSRKNSVFLLLLSLGGAFLAVRAMDRQVEKRHGQRQKELIRSYPDFVSRLQLYLAAGLTVKNAFVRLGRDYRQQKDRTGRKMFLYEELLICSYEFANGRAEDKIYQEWGRRCGEIHFRRLGFLLATYLRQGNDKLLPMLWEETQTALEERKNRAKKQGEEVGTKLLFPMILMLIVVMFLILLPAFVDLSGI